MPRDGIVYLHDILEAIDRIRDYTKGLDRQSFEQDRRTVDAVLHNLEIIGEASKNLPPPLKEEMSTVEWRKVGAMRDLLAHAYFQVDLDIVWNVVEEKIDPLEAAIRNVVGRESSTAPMAQLADHFETVGCAMDQRSGDGSTASHRLHPRRVPSGIDTAPNQIEALVSFSHGSPPSEAARREPTQSRRAGRAAAEASARGAAGHRAAAEAAHGSRARRAPGGG